MYFFIAGVIIATWAARIPAVKAQTGLSDGALSIGLLGLAVGALAAMQVAGRMVDRFGSAANIVPAAVFGSLALIAPGLSNSLASLFVALAAVGAGHGLIDVPMNVHAARVERRYGRPIMASFHAAFSIGGFVGAAVGALAAWVGLSPLITFTIVAVALVALALPARTHLLPGLDADSPVGAAPAGHSPPKRGRNRLPLKIVLFGLIAMCSMVAEGAATDWASVYLHDGLGASGAVAALGFSVFSAMMAAGRLVGDRLTARFGPVLLLRWGGLLAGGGLSAGLLVPSPLVGIVGFGLMGAGLSCIIPQVFTAATNHDPLRAGRNLGFVSAIGYFGLLSGPVAIGAISHSAGLGVALAVPVVLSLLIAAGAVTLRPGGSPAQEPQPEPAVAA
ncbi:MFS transporter [Salinactinospora qingdaonensis]|uniref:MFS transporter n=1 Tax=Salinactinospora qingdaonensis TaxID=702744 RepID=A0ABP7F5P7_9ACTN